MSDIRKDVLGVFLDDTVNLGPLGVLPRSATVPSGCCLFPLMILITDDPLKVLLLAWPALLAECKAFSLAINALAFAVCFVAFSSLVKHGCLQAKCDAWWMYQKKDLCVPCKSLESP